MRTRLNKHFVKHEIFYHGIRTALVLIALLVLALAMEMVSK